MEFIKRESYSETSCSNYQKQGPLGQRINENLCNNNKIQELTSILIQRKAQMRQAKIIQQNLLGKAEQQEYRLSQLKIIIQHELQKESTIMMHCNKLQTQISINKETIKDVVISIKNVKNQLTEILENTIQAKTNKADVENICAQLRHLLTDKKEQYFQIEDQIKNIQTLLLNIQNNVRSKQHELNNLQIVKNQFYTLLEIFQKKIAKAMKNKNYTSTQCHQQSQYLAKIEQQLQFITKQFKQISWSCGAVISQNCMIQELNKKLLNDLQAVKKHLFTIQKTNQVLKNSITQYGITGDKVTRIIASAKNCEM